MKERIMTYLATCVVGSLVFVAAAAIVVNDVALPATTWLELLAELALGTLPFVGLGVLIGLTVGVDSAQIVVMVSYLGMAVVGGLWAPLSSLPDVVATVGRVLPSFRLADLGWRTVAGQPIEATDVVALIGYTLAVALLVAWAYRRQETAAGG
jgi:ABC-2 type transport system permease protein